jgi:hypothetical protein
MVGQVIPVVGLESDRIVAALGRRLGDDPGVATLVRSVASIWSEIDASLSPVLGSRGVAMLYKRSLVLAGATHGWLPRVDEALPVTVDLAPLHAALMQQGNTVALDGGSAFLRTFYELLSSLVGPSLTERLLRSIWDNS